MKDKRQHARVAPHYLHPIEVQLVGNGFMDVLKARDISESGIGVEVPHQFKDCDISKDVELIVTLPGVRPFRAKGKIRHRGEVKGSSFFGLEFTAMPKGARELIALYVARRLGEGAAA